MKTAKYLVLAAVVILLYYLFEMFLDWLYPDGPPPDQSDGIAPYGSPWWYRLYLAVLWIGLPLCLLAGWLYRKLRDRAVRRAWRRRYDQPAEPK